MSLALSIEKKVRRASPVSLLIGLLITGFLLCLLSEWVGIGYLPPITVGHIKKIFGFWSSLNWSVTFLALFPLFMLFFCLQIQQCDLIRQTFANRSVVASSTGKRLEPDELNDAWREQLSSVSWILWLLLLLVLLQSSTDWWSSCGSALYHHVLHDEARDWSTAILVTANGQAHRKVLLFTLMAYAYMGGALFFYLTGLFYSVTFAYFLYKSSTQQNGRCIVFKESELCPQLGAFFDNAYAGIFLGLCAAFLMRLEDGYLISRARNIEEFLFRGFVQVWNGHFDFTLFNKPLLDQYPNLSRAPALALASYSLLSLVAIVVALYLIFTNAKRSTSTKMADHQWRLAVGLPHGSTARDVMNTAFRSSVIPNAQIYMILLIIVALGMTFLGIGLVFIAAILTCLVRLVLMQMKPSADERETRDG